MKQNKYKNCNSIKLSRQKSKIWIYILKRYTNQQTAVNTKIYFKNLLASKRKNISFGPPDKKAMLQERNVKLTCFSIAVF